MKPLFTCLFCILSLLVQAKKKSSSQNLSGIYALVKQFDHGQLIQVSYPKTKISFDQINKRIECYVGCNSIAAGYTAKKNQIEISDIISTEMACADYIDGLEAKFVENLGKINSYRFSEKNLFLIEGKKVLMVLRRK